MSEPNDILSLPDSGDPKPQCNNNFAHIKNMLASLIGAGLTFAKLTITNVFDFPQRIETYSDVVGNEAGIEGRRARGVKGAPEAVQAGDRLGLYTFTGYNGVEFPAHIDALLMAIATENHTPLAEGSCLQLEVKPNGGTTRYVMLRVTAPVVVTADATMSMIQSNVVVDSATPVTITMPLLDTVFGNVFYAPYTITNLGAGDVTIDFTSTDTTALGAGSITPVAQGQRVRLSLGVNNVGDKFWVQE